MKKLQLIIFLAFNITVYSQTLSEKYNSLMNRYEYYNSNGTLVGYKAYDSLMQTWNYYDVQQTQTKSNYQYVQPINLKLVNQALASKQSRYSANAQRVQDVISEINNNVYNSSNSADVINNSISDFNEKCMTVLNSKRYDYSSDSKTAEVINWLRSSMNGFVSYHIQQEKITEQKTLEDKAEFERKKAMSELAKFYGGYSTKLVTEEVYNKDSPGLYDVISEDKGITKFLFADSHLAFLRTKNKDWLGSAWVWFTTEPYLYVLFDDYNQLIAVSKDFKMVTFYSNKVGDIYMKRYVYHELKRE